MKKYQVIKTFGADRGFSCAFRQWRAESDCKFIHGYSLGFKLVLETETLDDKSWVYDFGAFDHIKKWIKDNFDHTYIIASDDPELDLLKEIGKRNVAKIIELDSVGCESFAEMTYDFASKYISNKTEGRVNLISVEVFEHGANSAVFKSL